MKLWEVLMGIYLMFAVHLVLLKQFSIKEVEMGWKFSLVGENRRCMRSVRRSMSWQTVAWKNGEQINEYLKMDRTEIGVMKGSEWD